jgi:hypothetical protein
MPKLCECLAESNKSSLPKMQKAICANKSKQEKRIQTHKEVNPQFKLPIVLQRQAEHELKLELKTLSSLSVGRMKPPKPSNSLSDYILLN